MVVYAELMLIGVVEFDWTKGPNANSAAETAPTKSIAQLYVARYSIDDCALVLHLLFMFCAQLMDVS